MQEHRFESREAASVAAAEQIIAKLERRISAQGEASLIVSGGSTPVRCFAALSCADIRWSDVHIVLSDERWVAPTHDDSNEKLVRASLLQGMASNASLLSMYGDGGDVAPRCEEVSAKLKVLPFPFACALLGMGTDGHFASLFPDAEQLQDALDPEYPALCMPVRTGASPYERISLTLTPIARSDEVILLIFGDDKWQTLQAARESSNGYPVSKLLTQKRAPVSVYWAP